MKNQDFTTTILVDQNAKQVFDAITNPRAWWSEEIEGVTDKLNAEWTYHYKDVHSCKMKVIESVPEKKVVWLVTDNYFNFTKDKSEWLDTKIIFEISKKGDKTHIRFTHMGLVPEYECFDICKNAWTDYIQDSLRNLIATGKGQPNPKEITVMPLDVVNMFYRLFTHKNEKGLSEIIAKDISFTGPFWKASGAKDFLEGVQRFLQVTKTYKVIKQFTDGNDVCVISTLEAQSPKGDSVSWDTADCFEVHDGKITRINLYFDPSVWGKAIGK